MKPIRFFLLFFCVGCGFEQKDLREESALAELDEAFFRCRVQPALSRSCAFPACHGTTDRYYRLYARNRLRMPKVELGAFMTDEERAANFEATLAMVDTGDTGRTLLLSKPLDTQDPEGNFHRGATLYGGGDVYLDTDDRDYKILLDWVEGQTAEPDCIEPGSEL